MLINNSNYSACEQVISIFSRVFPQFTLNIAKNPANSTCAIFNFLLFETGSYIIIFFLSTVEERLSQLNGKIYIRCQPFLLYFVHYLFVFLPLAINYSVIFLFRNKSHYVQVRLWPQQKVIQNMLCEVLRAVWD